MTELVKVGVPKRELGRDAMTIKLKPDCPSPKITMSSARLDLLLAEIDREMQRLQGKRDMLLELQEQSNSGDLEKVNDD